MDRGDEGSSAQKMSTAVRIEHKDVEEIPFQEASLDIWDRKYRLTAKDGTPIDAVVAIVKAVNSDHCKALADWGNSNANTEQGRIEELSKMFPYLGFVSAKELEFDAQNNHTSYDIVPIVKATEASGYKGIYSIEMWTNRNPPPDPVAAARTMMRQIAANLKLG